MRTTNKRPTDSQLVGLRRLLTMVHCRILHIVRASHSTNVIECSSRVERTMRNKRSGANGKTGLRTCRHVEHEIFGARSVNVWFSKRVCRRIIQGMYEHMHLVGRGAGINPHLFGVGMVVCASFFDLAVL